jgi:hypothetical protein
VTGLAVGDQVFAYTGLARPGGYGRYVVLLRSALAPAPAELGWAQAGDHPRLTEPGRTLVEEHRLDPLRPAGVPSTQIMIKLQQRAILQHLLGWDVALRDPVAGQQLTKQLRIRAVFSELEMILMWDVRAGWVESQSTAVRAFGPSRAGAAGGVREAGDAELNGMGAAGGYLVHLGEFGAGAGEADFQPFGLAEPAVGLGFGDAGDEVVADVDQPRPGGRVWSQEWAA